MEGKPISINGINFNSCWKASKYIANEENKIGNARNHLTISKELRRFLKGSRNNWYMYERYYIDFIKENNEYIQ